MKRFFTLLLAATMTMGFTSCSGIFDDLLDRVEDFVEDMEGEDDEDDGSSDTPGDGNDDNYTDEIRPINPSGPVTVQDWRINTIFQLNVAQGDLEDGYADLEFRFDYNDENKLRWMLLKNYSADNEIDSTSTLTFEYYDECVVCFVEEGVGGQANHHIVANRQITASLDEYGNIFHIDDQRFDTKDSLIGHEYENLQYYHYGNTGRRLESGEIYEWLIAHGQTEPEFYYQASYEWSKVHHVWKGYPDYTNTYPEYYESESNRNKTNLDINWLLANCSRAMNYTARGLGGLHPFLLQGLCGDPSSEYLINELTSAPYSSRHLYYRYTYHYDSDYGDGYPVKVQRFVTDDPSSDGNYTLESEFLIYYEPYEYVINPKE
ncbi:MAG: hypothetical protein J6K81_01010 [Rikenellaceae bacterium]|nr:hypothetical protein [Rikenellaceae bacterium]